MSIPLVQYFTHDATINGSRIGGSQSITIGKNQKSSDMIPWGDPLKTYAKFHKKPTVDISLVKILTNTFGPVFGSLDVRELIPKRPVDKFDLGATVYGGGSVKFADCILTGVSYSFKNTGIFTEELSFTGTISEVSADGPAGEGLTRAETGLPYQRQHYLGGTLPQEVQGRTILGIDINISIGYGKIPTFGYFATYKDSIVSLPIDISITYEVLDRGYNDGFFPHIGDIVQDEIQYRSISVTTVPVSMDFGTKNFLSSIDRGGANAGESSYSTLRFTYRNVENYFKTIFGSSAGIDGNLISEYDPVIDGNIPSQFTFIDGNL